MKSAGGSDPEPDRAARRGLDEAGPVFLERRGYRLRRVMDALRVLPVLGALLWAVPLLWTPGEVPTSRAIFYIFGVWVLLIAAGYGLSSRLGRASDSPAEERSAAQGGAGNGTGNGTGNGAGDGAEDGGFMGDKMPPGTLGPQ